MKNINRYIKQIFVLIAFVSIGMLSCKDDEEPTPVVTNIRVVAKDSAITGAEFGTLIAIQGNGFTSVRKVLFNDVEAEILPVYVTNSNILVQVTDEGPKEVNNKITLVTASGRMITADFQVVLPKPLITQLYNEFPKPGSETYVLGNYFFAIDKVLVGDQEVTILEQNPTAIKIKLPETIGQDKITVIGAGGTSVSTFRLNETEGNMVNFDIPATGWGSDVCWGDAERIKPEESEIEPVSGKYTRIKQTKLAATGYQGNWVISTCWFDFKLAPGPAEEKVFRFEAYIGEAWKAGYYNINIKTEDGKTFTYKWKPWDTDLYRASGIKTNGWMTFYIPLTNFTNESASDPVKVMADVSKIRDLFVAFSNGADGAAEIPSLYVALDNFRIVSNK
jgi:hypothetical protein